ncbi:MAG: hypothetical protein JXJ04_09415 [Spirochaetales bacterium]|nr:hypothetical protein [Spirochaetales bacterium]
MNSEVLKRLKLFFFAAFVCSIIGVVILLAPVLFFSPSLANELLLSIVCITGFIIFQVMAILLFLSYKAMLMELLHYQQKKETSFLSNLIDNLKFDNSKEIMEKIKVTIVDMILDIKKKEIE